MFRFLGIEKILINHCEYVDVFLLIDEGNDKELQIWSSPLLTIS